MQVQPPLPGTAPPPPPPEPSTPGNQSRFSQNTSTYPQQKTNAHPTSYHYDLATTESNPAYPNKWTSDSQSDNRQNRNKKRKTVRFGESNEYYDESCNDDGHDDYDENEEKSPEEIAFDEQFRKWEEQFATWKRENANHPDREAYFEYENKMQECRKKLLQRRAQMRAAKQQARDEANQQSNLPQPKQPPQTQTAQPPPQPAEHSQMSKEIRGSQASGQRDPVGPVYPANSFVPIPGLDLVNSRNNTPRNNFRNNNFGSDNFDNDQMRSRRKPNRFRRQDNVEEESTSDTQRRPPFGLRDFFDRFKDENNSEEQNQNRGFGGDANDNKFGFGNSRNNSSIMQQQHSAQPTPPDDRMNALPKLNENQSPIGNRNQVTAIRPLMDIEVPQFDSRDFSKSPSQDQPDETVDRENVSNERDSRFPSKPDNREPVNRNPFSQPHTDIGADNNLNLKRNNFSRFDDVRRNQPSETSTACQLNVARQFIPPVNPVIREETRDRFDDQTDTNIKQVLAKRLLDHFVPVKVIEYDHTPNRFQKLHLVKSIDYGHCTQQNKGPSSAQSLNEEPPSINPLKFFSKQQRNLEENSPRKPQRPFPVRNDRNDRNDRIERNDRNDRNDSDSSQSRQTTSSNTGNGRNKNNNNKRGADEWNPGSNNNEAKIKVDASPISSADDGNASDAKRQRRTSGEPRKESNAHAKSGDPPKGKDARTADKADLFPINKETMEKDDEKKVNVKEPPKISVEADKQHFVSIESLLCHPGRDTRPSK